MTEQLNDALTDEQRESTERVRVAWKAASERMLTMWDELAKAFPPIGEALEKIANSEPFQRGVLAGKWRRMGRLGGWLAWKLPLRVVRWLNKRIG